MRRIVILLLTVFLAGCATVGADRVEKLQSGTKVVPLSVLGNFLAIHYLGTTIFQDVKREIDVTDWQIDSFCESVAARIIRDGQKFVVLEADTKEARASAKLYTDFWTGEPKLHGGPDSAIKLATKAGADYIVVIGPFKLGTDPFFYTKASGFSGHGIYEYSFLFMNRAINFLSMQVVLLDGKSGAEVARTNDYSSSPRTGKNWMDSDNLNLTTSNAQETKSDIQALVEALLRKELVDLKLVP